MALHVLQRPDWDGTPRELGHLFRIHTDRGDQRIKAVCVLLSHQFGWELRLEVNSELQRSTRLPHPGRGTHHRRGVEGGHARERLAGLTGPSRCSNQLR